VTIIALQFDIAWEDKPANFATVERLIRAAAPPKDSLVVLPEMFATGFSMNAGAMAEPYGGPTEQFLAQTAKQFGIYLIGGAAMRGHDGQARNKALIFSPAGELIAFYAKLRPFAPGAEAAYYAAGRQPAVFYWGEFTVSPFICYDLRFPELFRQVATRHQPELFVVLANWPERRIHHWTRLLAARAIENQASVVGVNRIGADPHCRYSGRSLILDWHGEILADAGQTENAIRADLDLEALRKYRQELPFLKDATGIEH
jgi:omega-amidase